MRTVALIRKSLVIMASLAALSLMSGPSTTFATVTTIDPSPSSTYLVPGSWYDSGATLSEDVQGAFYHTSILINNKIYLRVGWMIKIDYEYMLIDELIEGGPGQPDTMVVQRHQNDSVTAFHPSGRKIKAHTATVSIKANQVTDSWGLGHFNVTVTLPPELQYIRLTPDATWLQSTGRSAWCDGPFHTEGSSIWQVSCSTTGNGGDSRYPLGPKGSGVIAKLVVLPEQDPGVYVASLSGSQLVNTTAEVIPVTTSAVYIGVIECPDADLNGRVDVGDSLMVALNSGDRGVDTGASLVSQADQSQTEMQISDRSLLSIGNTISIDAELMTVQALQESTPDVMTVARGVDLTPKKTHAAGAHIFRGTYDGNMDGKYGYTAPRDVNHDLRIDVGDSLLVALSTGTMCPSP